MMYVRCIKSGRGFEKNNTYPILGDNNGVQVGREGSHGDAYIELCHSYGDIIADCETQEVEFEPIGPHDQSLADKLERDIEDWKQWLLEKVIVTGVITYDDTLCIFNSIIKTIKEKT